MPPKRIPRDGLGRCVTNRLERAFIRRRRLFDVMRKLREVFRQLWKECGEEAPLLARSAEMQSHLDAIGQIVSKNAPFVACPECAGANVRHCGTCRTLGYITRDQYDAISAQAVPG